MFGGLFIREIAALLPRFLPLPVTALNGERAGVRGRKCTEQASDPHPNPLPIEEMGRGNTPRPPYNRGLQ
jgi:hypothetical protein